MPVAGVYGGSPAPMRQIGARRPLSFTSFQPAAPQPFGGVTGAGRTAAPAGGYGFSDLTNLAGGMRRTGWQPGQPMPGGLQLPGGTTTPPPPATTPWNPADPFAGAANLMDPIRAWLAQGGREGVFGPDYLAKQMRGRAMRNADAGKRRTDVLSRLLGLDPMQYRGAMVDADIAANQNTVGALNEAELLGMGGYQDFLKSLLNQERYGVENPQEQTNIGNRFQESQSRRDFWGGLAGAGVGAGIGALSGGG